MRIRKKRTRHEVLKIRMFMMKNNITQTDIARKLGVTVPAVNQVVTGQRNTARIVKALIVAGVPYTLLKHKELLTGESA
jgi:plasmid maintenance system antidote protein VapI